MQDDVVRSVQSSIETERDWVIDLTQRLVRIPSVNPKFHRDPIVNKEAEVQSLLESELQQLGLVTEKWDVFENRPNLVADLAGSDERSLILCGHIDVVPVGDPARWTVDPFGGEIKANKLYGRGSIDMK